MIARLIKWFYSIGFPKRSPSWPAVRAEHLRRQPFCQGCLGVTKLEVHHIVPYHVDPSLELDPHNLVTLCEGRMKCHFRIGHLGHWNDWNPLVAETCKAVAKDRSIYR